MKTYKKFTISLGLLIIVLMGSFYFAVNFTQKNSQDLLKSFDRSSQESAKFNNLKDKLVSLKADIHTLSNLRKTQMAQNIQQIEKKLISLELVSQNLVPSERGMILQLISSVRSYLKDYQNPDFIQPLETEVGGDVVYFLGENLLVLEKSAIETERLVIENKDLVFDEMILKFTSYFESLGEMDVSIANMLLSAKKFEKSIKVLFPQLNSSESLEEKQKWLREYHGLMGKLKSSLVLLSLNLSELKKIQKIKLQTEKNAVFSLADQIINNFDNSYIHFSTSSSQKLFDLTDRTNNRGKVFIGLVGFVVIVLCIIVMAYIKYSRKFTKVFSSFFVEIGGVHDLMNRFSALFMKVVDVFKEGRKSVRNIRESMDNYNLRLGNNGSEFKNVNKLLASDSNRIKDLEEGVRKIEKEIISYLEFNDSSLDLLKAIEGVSSSMVLLSDECSLKSQFLNDKKLEQDLYYVKIIAKKLSQSSRLLSSALNQKNKQFRLSQNLTDSLSGEICKIQEDYKNIQNLMDDLIITQKEFEQGYHDILCDVKEYEQRSEKNHRFLEKRIEGVQGMKARSEILQELSADLYSQIDSSFKNDQLDENKFERKKNKELRQYFGKLIQNNSQKFLSESAVDMENVKSSLERGKNRFQNRIDRGEKNDKNLVKRESKS